MPVTRSGKNKGKWREPSAPDHLANLPRKGHAYVSKNGRRLFDKRYEWNPRTKDEIVKAPPKDVSDRHVLGNPDLQDDLVVSCLFGRAYNGFLLMDEMLSVFMTQKPGDA